MTVYKTCFGYLLETNKINWSDEYAKLEQRLFQSERLRVDAMNERNDARDAARYFWEVIHGELSEQRASELASIYPWVEPDGEQK